MNRQIRMKEHEPYWIPIALHEHIDAAGNIQYTARHANHRITLE